MWDEVAWGVSGPVAILTTLGFVLSGRVENEGNQSNKHVNVINSHVMRVQRESKPELTGKNSFQKKLVLKSLKQL